MSLDVLVTTGRMINTTTSSRFILKPENICCKSTYTMHRRERALFWRVGGGAPGSRVGWGGWCSLELAAWEPALSSGEHHPGATMFASTCTLIKEYELCIRVAKSGKSGRHICVFFLTWCFAQIRNRISLQLSCVMCM